MRPECSACRCLNGKQLRGPLQPISDYRRILREKVTMLQRRHYKTLLVGSSSNILGQRRPSLGPKLSSSFVWNQKRPKIAIFEFFRKFSKVWIFPQVFLAYGIILVAGCFPAPIRAKCSARIRFAQLMQCRTVSENVFNIISRVSFSNLARPG